MLRFMRTAVCAGVVAALSFGLATAQTGDQKKADDKKTEQEADDKKSDDKKAEQKKDDAKKTDEQKKADAKDDVKKAIVKTLTDKNRYAKVDLRPGEKLMVDLPANPTTGYTWVMASAENPSFRIEGKPIYEPADKDSKNIGGGGTMTFTFQAYAAGEVEVILQYLRPFEKGREPEKTFSFTVRIQ